MSEWFNVIVGLLTLLLTAIGILVYNYLGHLSSESEKNFKQFEKAISELWNHIRTQQDGCTEMHLQIAREIGELRAKTQSNIENIVSLEARFWEKMRNVTEFAREAKSELVAIIAQIDNKFNSFLVQRNNKKI